MAEDRIRQLLEHEKKLFAEIPLKIVTEKIKEEEIWIPGEDGVKLRTQIWLPENVSPAPTVVVRSCYPQQEPMVVQRAEEFAKRGFGFVLQWCRGTGGSEGAWEPNVYDRTDGLSLMNYLQQDDRFGNLGYWGDSYLAFTGWVMADAVPEKVRTMYLGVYGCDRHVSAYKDGLFRQDILTAWAMDNAGHPVDADYMTSAAFRPQVRVDEALWGGRLDWYRDWITNTDRDCPYWSSGFWKELMDIPGKIRIPLFIKEGWYDHHLGSALVTYDRLSKEAKAHSTLEVGPWNHGYRPAVRHQELNNLGDTSLSSPMLWFDRILRRGEMPDGLTRRYVIGADCWEEKPAGTDQETEIVRFYLQEGKLSQTAPLETGTVEYDYDPNDPVPSYGAESLFKTMQNVGSLIQPEPDYRADVKSFLSDPIEKALSIEGSITVRLYVQSDAEDTSFTAKLMEVFPDGQAVNIRGSITTLAYRNGRAKRGTYVPGECVEITIPMWDISWKVQAGSRLRLDISSSDFPQYAVHPNVTGPWSLAEETKTAHQTVCFGESCPSAVELPVRS